MGGRGRPSLGYHLHLGKQGKHIKGHNNYIEGRSVVTISVAKIEELFDKYHGTGEMIGNKEIVDFHEIIGEYRNLSDKPPLPTTWVKIHYSYDGRYHIVPENPLIHK